jgi:hypothetical protein
MHRTLCPCGKERKEVWADFGRNCFMSLPRDLRTRLCSSRGMKGSIKDQNVHDAVVNECLAWLAAQSLNTIIPGQKRKAA